MVHPTPEDLLTVAQVAKILNYSEEHVRRFIREGKLPARKPKGGRKYIIERSSLDELLVTKDERIRENARKDAMKESPLTQQEQAALRSLLLN